VTRSTVEIAGVFAADPVVADPPDSPAAPEDEAEDAGLPPAALLAPPLVAPLLDIVFDLI
jgi:hypothetical protein